MNAVLHFFVHYEYLVLFSWVLLEQFGIPIPAEPLLLAAGPSAWSVLSACPPFFFL